MTEGPFAGLPVQAVPTDYLDFINRTRPLPWSETVAIDSVLQHRKRTWRNCPLCGRGDYSARNNRFGYGVNKGGRR